MDLYESADYRAEALLCRVLPEGQWAHFIDTGSLEISGSRGTYCISAFEHTTVVDSKTRRPIATACLQLSVPAPPHDRVIAEYMLIRNDEDLYWQTAQDPPPAVPPDQWTQPIVGTTTLRTATVLGYEPRAAVWGWFA